MAIEHIAGESAGRVVAVGVLSNPALNCRAREAALGLERVPKEWKWAYLNRHLRTISRVIVHPQYRGIGLSSAVVRFILQQCPTRYVDAISRLAAHHPLFERAGMQRIARERRQDGVLPDRPDAGGGRRSRMETAIPDRERDHRTAAKQVCL